MLYHYVILDCACKLVLTPEPGVVRYLAANKLRVSHREGAQEFISLANVEVKINVSIEDMVLVKEYPHVFLTEILRLPPVREVKFFIDLHPRTGHISIALYRMSPLELNKLKGQVEDLLQKGFIKPSVSPWGAPVFFHASIGMTPYEALYERKCQTPLCCYKDSDNMIVGPEMVQQTIYKVKKIKEKMKVSQDRQRSYVDKRRRPLEFEQGGHMFLRVTPMIGVGRAIKSRKLTPKFIGPYQITARIGHVAYRIALPLMLSNIHNVLHVSQLRKYISDLSHVIEPDTVQLKDNLSFEVLPVRIDDMKIKRLRNKEVSLVEVIWNPTTEDATLEQEGMMREQHPNLFIDA
ncbi:uncharacterized protein [Cicer arietinum]|uniref:uncharacterized protein n=1 Tax=Cicer arietinum TaxID=3827 RepID=UPI003CC64799